MNYVNFIIILFLVGFLMIGGEMYKSDQQLGIERDIYNYTETSINIPPTNISLNHPIEKTRGVINEGRLYLIVESFINFIFVSVEQVIKMGIEFGYQNPDLDWKGIFNYLKIIFIIVILVLLIKPIGYLIIFLVMLIMYINERIKKRKKLEVKTKWNTKINV